MGKKHTLIDMAGQRFGKLAVISRAENSLDGSAQWLCQCDCGKSANIRGTNLRSGEVKSCGCSTGEFVANAHRTHGQSKTPIYRTWQSMRERCKNTKSKLYPDYGGRGIRVCDRWASFENFAQDMGPRPDGYSLDRINNDGNYSPENCRWTDWNCQANNRRNGKLINVNGEMVTIKEASELTGVPHHTIRGRLRKGMSDAEALAPVGSYY